MQLFLNNLKNELYSYLQTLVEEDVRQVALHFELTNPEHQGNLTLLVFPLAKMAKKNPEEMAHVLGKWMVDMEVAASYEVIKGFLNINLSAKSWHEINSNLLKIEKVQNSETIVLEYCGPNTNKPLHIGHLRNLFLGFSMGRILQEAGHSVHKVNINNDRGIAICKSLIAYQLYGNGATPDSVGKKGDHFVGDYYVKFAEVLKAQIEEGIAKGLDKKTAEKQAPITQANEELLRKWENGDNETIALWQKMNGWVYDGFKTTFDELEIDFEKEYYESQEYLNGKEIVQAGYEKGVFKKDETGAFLIDLTAEGLDEKIVQRADGTSIYITQDLALIKKRYDDFKMDRMIYVVADEQNYHFKVLQGICKALDMDFSKSIHHMSYGMVVSKDGSKFKSREGTAVDADDIIAATIEEAKNQTMASGKANHFSDEYLQELSKIIGLGALRFGMLKVNLKKSIPFDPAESVDMQGDTGTFVQYSFVRTQAILNKENYTFSPSEIPASMEKEEKDLLIHIAQFNKVLHLAASQYDPTEIAQFVLTLAKLFNRFYTKHQILNVEDPNCKNFRLYLTYVSNFFIQKSLYLLGIKSPEKM